MGQIDVKIRRGKINLFFNMSNFLRAYSIYKCIYYFTLVELNLNNGGVSETYTYQ